ncbi:MAG: hypothetical protein K6G26_06635, partial [Lachnospiraceae bacterium]|nr:hypothetical protein [Lachnospiraceae bacterium]
MMKSSLKSIKKNLSYEWLVVFFYTVLVILIVLKHEIWFDEAQAWLIADEADLKTIVGTITHNEGHPPIWYMLLMPFSAMGIKGDIALKILNIAIMVVSVAIFEKKAPFNKIIKILLPFTYFLFYQYGVISRPYCIMALGFMLLSAFYKEREEKPFRYVLSMLLICASSTYGIMVACGICIHWLFESINFMDIKKSIIDFFKTNKFKSLLVLLIINIAFVIMVMPRKDTYAIVVKPHYSLGTMIIRIIYTLFIVPANAFFEYSYSKVYGLPMTINTFTRVIELICGIIFMLIIFGYMYYNKKLIEFIIPYIMISIFSAAAYFMVHHIGIYNLYIIYMLWICCENKVKRTELIEKFKKHFDEKQQRQIQYFRYAMVLYGLGISIYWSIMASINDIKYPYAIGKEIADFVNEYDLTEYRIMSRWEDLRYSDENAYYDLNRASMDCISSLLYFDENIYYNMNYKTHVKYRVHIVDQDTSIYKTWEEEGMPDFVFGEETPVNMVFPGKSLESDYTLIKVLYNNKCWKSEINKERFPIYIRNDLLDEF